MPQYYRGEPQLACRNAAGAGPRGAESDAAMSEASSLPDGVDTPMPLAKPNAAGHGVTLPEAFWVWLRVAALSFGGPAGQIAVMHRIIVDEKRWIGVFILMNALS